MRQGICLEHYGNRDFLRGCKMIIVFLLEEKSMKYLLDGILPYILPDGVRFITIPHEGKSDLQKSIPNKLQGWNMPDTKFVIVQDQDSNDCRQLKRQLEDICMPYSNKEILIRIAYNKDLRVIKNKKKYRVPDDIVNPKRELQKLLPEHQQIIGAQRIAKYMNMENNTSVSFRMFVDGVRRLACASEKVCNIE